MIAHLTGLLFKKTTQSVILEAGGIGYEVFIPLSTFYSLPKEEERASLHVHTHVREDALVLFGFHSRLEKDLFTMLISVSGIGPKLAINILSGIGPQELLMAIASGDAVSLRAIPGVGKKTAERIALELKDRAARMIGDQQLPLSQPTETGETLLFDDAISALTNLGYPPKSAKQAIEKVRSSLREMSLEGLIKEALKAMA
jgi:Holliday junction DNA helicase RuvA